MWLMYAAGSAFFAGITSILAKCGIRKTDSTVATAVRTEVVLIFSWLIAGAAGSVDQVRSVDGKTLWFLILSGLECAGDGSIFLFCVWGDFKQESRYRADSFDGRNSGDGVHFIEPCRAGFF